jgi:hypothetical protein
MNHSFFQLRGWKYILTGHHLRAANRTVTTSACSGFVGEEPNDPEFGLHAICSDCAIHKIKMTFG